MRYIVCFLFCLFTAYCFSQKKNDSSQTISTKTVRSDEIKTNKSVSDSVSKTFNKYWEFSCNSADNKEWYINKEYEGKAGRLIKLSVMGYLRNYIKNNHSYEKVVLKELVLFDCDKKEYKIMEGAYYQNLTALFDVFDNPTGIMKKIEPNTVMSCLLDAACKKFL